MGNFTELDMYLFGQATHYDIYKKLGAHPQTRKRKKGICFCASCVKGFCHRRI